jgi:hypothetical protein
MPGTPSVFFYEGNRSKSEKKSLKSVEKVRRKTRDGIG